jgi:hypothetical protein
LLSARFLCTSSIAGALLLPGPFKNLLMAALPNMFFRLFLQFHRPVHHLASKALLHIHHAYQQIAAGGVNCQIDKNMES